MKEGNCRDPDRFVGSVMLVPRLLEAVFASDGNVMFCGRIRASPGLINEL